MKRVLRAIVSISLACAALACSTNAARALARGVPGEQARSAAAAYQLAGRSPA